MNLSEKLIASGFKPDTGTNSVFNPKNNWMGVSVYQPDVFFDKGNKTVHLSVQGLAMPTPSPMTKEMLSLLQNRAARYIGFSIDRGKIYESWTGVMPTEEFINDFLS